MFPPDSSTPRPLARPSLAGLCALGFGASLWALFQWSELLVARAGGRPFCGMGNETGTSGCAALWDSPFARAVQDGLILPIAGWGLVWGIVAAALPLLALARQSPGEMRGLPVALRLTAAAGSAAIVILAGVSLLARTICLGCLGTYVLVIAWTALAFWTTRGLALRADVTRGIGLAAGIGAATFLALLGPGLRTPRALDDLSREALAAAAEIAGRNGTDGTDGTDRTDRTLAGPFDGPSTGDARKDEALRQFIAQLPAQALQTTADWLADYERAPRSEAIPPARVVLGAPGGAVRVVFWTDPLCPHCAALRAILDDLLKIAPGVLAIEPHFFPLDRRCNPAVTLQDPDAAGEVRCVATRALLCLEEDPRKFHLAQKLLYENARGLTIDTLWEVLSPIASQESLAARLTSPSSQEKLEGDIASAQANHLQGAPLVLLNGKEVQPFGPLLYVLTVTGGATKSAGLSALPAPQLRAKPLPLPQSLPQPNSGPTPGMPPAPAETAPPTRKRLTVPRPGRSGE